VKARPSAWRTALCAPSQPISHRAATLQMRLEQALGFRLRQHQRIGMRALDAGKADPADQPAAGHNVGRVDLQPGRDQRLRGARAVEQLQGPAPQDERLRLIGAPRRLVDDPDGNPIARQFGRHGQSDRPRPNHQRLQTHRSPRDPPQRPE
jgi:hypothetical protein